MIPEESNKTIETRETRLFKVALHVFGECGLLKVNL